MALINRLENIGRTGLNHSDGYITEEWHRRLRGKKGARKFREMRDNSAITGASLLVISTLIRNTNWFPEPADHPRGEEAAEFLTQCIDDMEHTWTEFMAEVVSVLPFGWSLFEKVLKIRGGNTDNPETRSKYDDNRIGWRKFSIRGQETVDHWEIDKEGNVLGMWQLSPPDYVLNFIPMDKSLLFRTEPNKNNPEGRSMLRSVYRSYYKKVRLEDIETVGAERELVGLPTARAPQDYFDAPAGSPKAAVLDAVEKALANVRNNEQGYLVFPASEDRRGKTGWDIGLMSTGGRRAIDIDKSITRYEKRESMGLLTQFLFLGMDKVGSFSLASSMTDTFALSVGAILRGIEEVFNRFAVQELFELNTFPREAWPRWTYGDIEKEDMGQFADALLKLTGSGAITADSKLEDWVRQRFEFPEREEEGPDSDEDVFGAPVNRGRNEPEDVEEPDIEVPEAE